MSTIAFDIISDLNLEENDSFNWEGKSTSLYCIVAGNISKNSSTVKQTLLHLNKFYQGVFYINGSLEYENIYKVKQKHTELTKICNNIQNVIFLHNYVVVVENIAIMGISGWYNTLDNTPDLEDQTVKIIKYKHYQNDMLYLNSTISKLQLHLDVKKVIVVSHCAPENKLYFGQEPDNIINMSDTIEMVKEIDTEKKITNWVFGHYDNDVDIDMNGIRFTNNPYYKKNPYWAKRIEV